MKSQVKLVISVLSILVLSWVLAACSGAPATAAPTQPSSATSISTATTPPLTPLSNARVQFTPALSSNVLYFGDCAPNSLDVSVTLSDPGLAAKVLLFVALSDKDTYDFSGWNEGFTMASQGGGKYAYELAASSVPRYNKYYAAWLHYEFVALADNGQVLPKSKAYYNVDFYQCGYPFQKTPTPGR
ncbi:MAG TPA: hypothetical protein VMC62_05360 [Longilinea sp.]|nr:hypothetical protein [Longilinea sp.]